MILKTLELKDFRNYEKEEIIFHKKINILTGRNAQGKTNLIEAINLLSLGKSFRTRKEQELVRFDTEEAVVKGIIEKKDRLHSTEIKIYAGSPGKKEYFVNGLCTSTVSDLLGGVYTIVFSPEDLKIIKGDPETRRRFLDREIILLKPLYYHKLKKYRQALKTRNALLKNEKVSIELLDVYDTQIAEAASEVMKERKEWLKKLSSAAAETCSCITGGKETLNIEYKPHLSHIGDEYRSEEIYEVMLKGREKDLLYRSTESGPHRDDFSVYTNGLDLRVYGSQGQQRTAALSLRLAERELIKKETGEDAILLLDDVMSELDQIRQEKLLESFGDNQIFITAAGPFREEALRLGAAKVMKIQDGKIT
jgi:DNA replication and repair protein RecF